MFTGKSIGQVESGFTNRSKCGIKIAVYNNEVLMAKKRNFLFRVRCINSSKEGYLRNEDPRNNDY